MLDTKWVRLHADVECGLRRGGWYRAASVDRANIVIEMHGKLRSFPRELFEVTADGPTKWTIVSGAGNSARIPARWSEGYVVCPSCRWRQLLLGHPESLLCEGCYEEFEVDWNTLHLSAG